MLEEKAGAGQSRTSKNLTRLQRLKKNSGEPASVDESPSPPKYNLENPNVRRIPLTADKPVLVGRRTAADPARKSQIICAAQRVPLFEP